MSLRRNNVRQNVPYDGTSCCGSRVDHAGMPTGMRVSPYPQASTEVRMFGSVGSAQHTRDHSPVTRLSSEGRSYISLEVHSNRNTFETEI